MYPKVMPTFIVVAALIGCVSAQLPTFLVQNSGGVYGLSLGSWQQPQPVIAQVVFHNRTIQELSSAYTSWTASTQTASATITTPSGTQLMFQDTFSSTSNGFQVSRTVSVQAASTHEYAFSTIFTMQAGKASGISDQEFFMPGVWYRNGINVPTPWFGTDPNVKNVFVREDRTAYPLIMARDPSTSSWSALLHLNPNGTTIMDDNSFLTPIVNANLQYGSIGVVNTGTLQLAFAYPGSEGDTTRCGGATKASTWAYRNHPLTVGFSHSYQVAFIQGSQNSFAEAVQASWRYAFNAANPKPPTADRTAIFIETMGLVGEYVQQYNGIPSVPFTINITSGAVLDASSQFGFTGKAPFIAAVMIAANMGKTTVQLQQPNSTWSNNAIAIIDTWVNNSMTKYGVPKTWYNTGTGTISWRGANAYMGHIRVLSDGLKGVLTAWKLIQKPYWLSYCQTAGDFFVSNQAADGSFAGAWFWTNGSEAAQYQNTTYFVIPFLLDLYNATGNVSYQQCALKAGEYSYQNVHSQYLYAGGAADNPNVRDKESGVMAFNAFLALYEATQDNKWLTAAIQAGTYCESFVYIWAVPQFTGAGYMPLPSPRTVMGSSFVATGRSAADNYMAACVHLYKRLYDYTCDTHFLQFSQFLADATAQLMNWDGQLGYARRGLMPEAISIVDRGDMAKAGGTDAWLAWLTACVLEPYMPMKNVSSSCTTTTASPSSTALSSSTNAGGASTIVSGTSTATSGVASTKAPGASSSTSVSTSTAAPIAGSSTSGTTASKATSDTRVPDIAFVLLLLVARLFAGLLA